MLEAQENLQIFDHMGCPIGVADRVLANRLGLWHLCSQIWVVLKRDPIAQSQLVFQKRSALRRVSPGIMDVSAAGHVVLGATAVETAIAECREELGIGLDPSDLCYIGRRIDMYENANVLSRIFADVFVVFADELGFRPRCDPEEVAGLVLLPIAEVLSLARSEKQSVTGRLLSSDPTSSSGDTAIEVAFEDLLPRHDWYYRKVAETCIALLEGRPPIGV